MSTQSKCNNKLILMILLTMAVIAVIAIYFGIIRHHRTLSASEVKIDGMFLATAQDISDFQLIDNKGKPFTKENLKGHWTMVFFGFTNCGYVCPTTLSALNKMYQTLQAELPVDQMPQVVMISVDPERDTVKRMNSYVTAFNPHFIGTRADESATDALEKQFHIAAAKIQVDGKGKDHYTIDHTAEIILLNPDAKIQAFLSYPHLSAKMVKDYKLILMATQA
jgi:protein SCO1